MDPAKLEAYRKNWTNDTPASRSMRFQTESRRAGNSGTKPEFSVQSVRFLPGTPIAFERLREKLLERYGILGMSALRSALGNAKEVSSADFFKAMKTAAVEVSRVEIQQMLAYLTPTDSFACDKLMHLIKGRIEYTSNIEIKELFALLLYNCGENSNCIGIDQISLLMNARKFMDIAQGLNIYLPCYCIDGCLDVDGFECLCLDMYNSSPNNFTSIMKDLWGAL